MTKSECGKLGGLKTLSKYGNGYMKLIGKKGAEVFYKKYYLKPYGTSYFGIYDRKTNQLIKIRHS